MNYIKLINYSNPKRFLDIGAHTGDFTKDLTRLAPDCEVIMVEANPNCEPYLQKLKYGFYMEDILDYLKFNKNQISQMDILFKNSYIF